MLDWVSELRAIEAAPPFARAAKLAPGYVAGPLRQVREFVDTLCSQLDDSLDTLAGREPNGPPIVIEVDLIVEMDPDVLAEWEKELKAVRRKMRWGF